MFIRHPGVLWLAVVLLALTWVSRSELLLMAMPIWLFMDLACAWIEELFYYREQTIRDKDRTDTIIGEAFAGIMVVDADLRITSLNPGAEAITGYRSEEAVNRRLPDLFEAGLWDEDSLLHKSMVAGQRVGPAEATLMGGDGRRDILRGVAPLQDDYLLSFADISQLKELERLKTNIVANVSHELRTPLASICAYTELLMMNLDGGNPETRQRFLRVIDHAAQSLGNLITDQLDLARLESSVLEPRRQPVLLSDTAAEVLGRFQAQARAQGIQLLMDAPSDLPYLRADPQMMTMMVRNLVSNAIKFSPHGGDVEVSLRANGGRQILTVADQGVGIASEDLPHVFEKFYRSRSSAELGFEGTGLGLALVREVVDAHGGNIDVQSEWGKGSRFTIDLPIDPSSSEFERTVKRLARTPAVGEPMLPS
jgi:PAS domain S-box-containing protein